MAAKSPTAQVPVPSLRQQGGTLEADIVIVGGGMSAVMAALAAKRPDNRVLIVESSNVLGGQGTYGGVAGFCGDTQRVNREFAELVTRLKRHGLIEPYRSNDDRRAYDLEWCAFFLQELVAERGIDILFHARVIGATARDGRVEALTVSTAGSLLTLVPRFVIDGSGSCIVPVLTGFPVEHEGANRQLPMSLYFTLWNTGKPVTPVLPEGCPRWTHDEEIPMTSVHHFATGKVEVKMKVVGFDAADGLSRSAAEIFARRQMHGIIYYLQTIGYKGVRLDTHVLASVSRGIGVREERRIVGEHVLTEAEARRAAIFPDAVAVNTYHIDYHWPDRMERAGTGITDMLDPHHLPLRMMIPKGARNLLVPGRGASGDQTAMSAYRVMAVVAQMGYAAGHAASQCVAAGTDLAQIDVSRLQAAIQAGGQSLDLSDYGDYLRYDIFTEEAVRPELWPGVPTSAPAALLLTNGRVLVVWGAAGKLWQTERREKQWQAPRELPTGLPVAATAPWLQKEADGRITLGFVTSDDSPWRMISPDEGAGWSPPVAADRPGEPGLIASDGGRLTLVYGQSSGQTEVRVRWTDRSGAQEVLGTPMELAGECSAALTRLDDGTVALALLGPETGGQTVVSVALTRDGGATWLGFRPIQAGVRARHGPAIVATRTGLAVVTLRDDGLNFWHGSPERITAGPPQASAHALQA